MRPLIAIATGLCIPNPILAEANLSTGETAQALIIFILVSLCTLITPVVVCVRSPDTVTSRLQDWKKWLSASSGTILTVFLVFYGALLIAEWADTLRRV